MPSKILTVVRSHFEGYGKDAFLVTNPDKFLARNDVKLQLAQLGLRVVQKEGLELRVDFELNFKRNPSPTIYLVTNPDQYLEDIRNACYTMSFTLSDILPEFHQNTILNEDLAKLDFLYDHKPLTKQSKRDTEEILKITVSQDDRFNIHFFLSKLEEYKSQVNIDWLECITTISTAINECVGSSSSDDFFSELNRFNLEIQSKLMEAYRSSISASFVKKPSMVASILDHINFNHKSDSKVCLMVVDGMAFWQYQILSDQLEDLCIKEEAIYSWIPSITQLSRQAIFRGSSPLDNYVQGPINEKKLWTEYWSGKGIISNAIDYRHDEVDIDSRLNSITRYAIVLKDLDEKMHSSSDYVDLKALSENWLLKSKIPEKIKSLTNQGFTVYLTTDHGNIPSYGWRMLKGIEKLGANKSGSRSARHIEFSEKHLADKFLSDNPDIAKYIHQKDNILYLFNESSFKKEGDLVTHGGSHLLEVIIPFVKITNA